MTRTTHTAHTTGEQATAPPESEVVGRLLKTWLYYRSGIFFRDVRGTCPHDALTVAEAIYPGADRVQLAPPSPRKKMFGWLIGCVLSVCAVG
jgi:hypothetical protein